MERVLKPLEQHFQIDFFVSTVSAGYMGYEVYIL